MKLSREYLAGLFDGEGCIHIAKIINKNTKRPSYGVRAIFCLTNESVIKIIAEQYGMAYCRLRKSSSNENWRDAYQTQICGNVAMNFLNDILPFLIIKKNEAILAIMLQEHINKYRAKFYNMSPQEKADIDSFRENLKTQIMLLKRVDASIGMMANSGEIPCPVSDDAEGQSRAKQTTLSVVGRV